MRIGSILAALIVVAGLALGMSACGSSSDGGTTGAGSSEAGVSIGYAGLGRQFPFEADVDSGFEAAAKKAGDELFILDNKFDPQVALQNTEVIIQRHPDVVVEFQTDAGINATLCKKFEEAGLTEIIAIDIPMPCAAFFGADNELAGEIAGEEIAKVAKERWGSVEELVLLELPQSGELPLMRTDSYLKGVQKVFPEFSENDVIKVNGEGSLEASQQVMSDLLPKLSRFKHILLGAVNDPSAVGALRAIEAGGKTSDFIVGGQNATIEARQELCNHNPTFVGSVAYFPEKYGEYLVKLADKMAAGQSVPDMNYVKHVWIDAANIRKYYPNC